VMFIGQLNLISTQTKPDFSLSHCEPTLALTRRQATVVTPKETE
jgi:hypothetical protein